MSDMSSLSHEYSSTTDFSHEVNRAVLLLKKLHHGTPPEWLDPSEVSKAGRLIRGLVARLLQRMGESVGKEEIPKESPVIPEDVQMRLEEKQSGNLEYFIEDLLGLRQTLAHGSDLSAKELELLDSICAVADASASATFCKLQAR